MKASDAPHPSHDDLFAYLSGKLNAVDSESIEAHLNQCESCCEVLSAAPSEDTIDSILRQKEADTSISPETPAVQDESPRENGIAPTIVPESDEETRAPRGEVTAVPGLDADALKLPPELRDHPRYKIVELLGHGGMGDVYRAEHKVMSRQVALKVIKPQLVQNDAAVRRFQREVKAAARLEHPNIVTAFDAEQAGDLHYLVMSFVDGVDLDEVIRERGPLPVEEACDYIRQAAEGLQHAHELGMVHRDIKPHNLMLAGGERRAESREQEAADHTSGSQLSALSSQPSVKILDFGLANFASEVAEDELKHPEAGDETGAQVLESTVAGASILHQLTQMGTMMGTPDYIAPEQARDAHTADIRSDIYSLGCTFYTLLTAKAPFGEGSVLDKVKAHTEQDAPPLSDFRDDVPADVEAVLRKMIAKDPAQRYQTPAEVAEALSAVGRIANPSHKRRRPLVLTAVATLFLALIAAAATIFYIQTDNGVVRVEVTDPSLQVTISGQTIMMNDGEKPLTIRAGEQKLIVRQKDSDFELVTDSFQLRRGDRVALKVDLRPGEVVVSKDGQRFQAKAVRGTESAPPRNEVVFRISKNENGPGTISRFQGEIVKDPDAFLERLKLMAAENPDLVVRIEGRLDLERDDFLENFENAIRAAGVRFIKLPPEIEQQRRDAAARRLAEEQKRATRKYNLKLIGIALREYLGRAGEFPPSASVVPVPPAPRETSSARGPSRSPKAPNTGTKKPTPESQTPASQTNVAKPGRSPDDFFDERGRPHLSWRVHLLPFFRQKELTELYKQFHLDEPWDSPHNKPLLDQMPDVYKTTDDSTKTTLLAVVGEGTAYEGKAGFSQESFKDGLLNTAYVVDAGRERAVPWTKPEDLPFDQEDPIRAFGTSDFGDIFLALMADIDSAVHEIPRNTAPDSLRALFTRAAGDKFDENAKRTTPLPQSVRPKQADGITTVHEFSDPKSFVRDVAFSPNGRLAAAVSDAGRLFVWEIDTRKTLIQEQAAPQFRSVAFSPEGRRLVASGGPQAWVWDLLNPDEKEKLNFDGDKIDDCVFLSEEICAGVVDGGTVHTFRSDNGFRRYTVSGGSPLPANDSQWFAVYRPDAIAAHAAETGELLRTFKAGAFQPMWRLGMTGSGFKLAAGSQAGDVIVWEADTGKQVHRMRAHVGRSCIGGFSAFGKRLVSHGDDGMYRVWDLEFGKQIRSFPFGAQGAWTHYNMRSKFLDNTRLLFVDASDVIHIWDVEEDREIARHQAPENSTRDIAVSPSGEYLLTGGGFSELSGKLEDTGDYKVRLWQLPQ